MATALFQNSLFSARGAAGVRGRFHLANNTGLVSLDDGVDWIEIPWYDVTSLTAAGTVADGTRQALVLCDATTAAFTVTLPTAAAGLPVTIKKTDASANAITVATPGAETIDGAASTSVGTQWDYVTVVSDGTNWFVV